MKKIKETRGITLISLIIMMIFLVIIAGISIMGGTNLVNTANAETIETNMLTIKAKAKEYIENVDSKNWALTDNNTDSEYQGLSTKEGKNRIELTSEKYQLTLINEDNKTTFTNYSIWYKDASNKYTYYAIEKKALDKMGLSNMYKEEETYIIRYPLEDGDTANLEMDIIYANGIEYENNIYYNLSELEQAL